MAGREIDTLSVRRAQPLNNNTYKEKRERELSRMESIGLAIETRQSTP